MIKYQIMKNETVQPNTRELEKLKEILPQYFDKEGNFKLDSFKEMLKSNEINVEKEGYELKFLGKNYSKFQSGLETETVIVPDIEHNSKEENINSENMYIVGDNLDALKHLLKSYSNKIKCIYIDPPYNTGSDGFVYNDSFSFTSEILSEKMGIDKEEAKRIIELRGKSNHSAWLTFMYSRLELARDLLTDDGVIFISIDDNEQANLKLICDEIFGEENFVANFIRNTGSTRAMAKFFDTRHDYIIIYAKDIISLSLNERENSDIKNYMNLDNDKNGPWSTQDLTVRTGGYEYEIPSINGKIIFKRNWRFPKEILKEKLGGKREEDFSEIYKKAFYIEKKNWYSLNEFVFKGDENIINHKKYAKDVRTLKNHTLYDNVGSNKGASSTFYTLFKNNSFETPKPIELLKYLSYIGSDCKNSIILDFFSGSATTAHAVMQLNAEDGGNRKFIMVQLNELTYDGKKEKYIDENGEERERYIIDEETGYPIVAKDSEARKEGFYTICEIGKERIRRAGEKIKEENPNTDCGFKLFRLREVEQNMIDKIIEFDPKVPTLLLEDYVEAFKYENTSGKDTILTTWLNEDGYGLIAKSKKVKLINYEIDVYNNSAYIIEQGITSEDIMRLIEMIEENILKVNRIVIYPYSIQFNTIRELKNNIKQLHVDVELIERY